MHMQILQWLIYLSKMSENEKYYHAVVAFEEDNECNKNWLTWLVFELP